MARLTQPLGDIGVLGEGRAEGRRGVLQLRGRRQQQGLGVPFRVVGPPGQVGDLGGDRGSGGGGAGGPRACRAGRAGSWPGWPGRPGCGRSSPPVRPVAGPAGGRPAPSVAAGGRAPRSPSPRCVVPAPCSALAGGVEYGDEIDARHREAGIDAIQGPVRPHRGGRPGPVRWPGPMRCRAVSRAGTASPARSRRSASAVSRPTRSASDSRRPAASTADRSRVRCPAASAKAKRAESASAAIMGPGHRGRGAGDRDARR